MEWNPVTIVTQVGSSDATVERADEIGVEGSLGATTHDVENASTRHEIAGNRHERSGLAIMAAEPAASRSA